MDFEKFDAKLAREITSNQRDALNLILYNIRQRAYQAYNDLQVLNIAEPIINKLTELGFTVVFISHSFNGPYYKIGW